VETADSSKAKQAGIYCSGINRSSGIWGAGKFHLKVPKDNIEWIGYDVIERSKCARMTA
jgi:hypothetical protein